MILLNFKFALFTRKLATIVFAFLGMCHLSDARTVELIPGHG